MYKIIITIFAFGKISQPFSNINGGSYANHCFGLPIISWVTQKEMRYEQDQGKSQKV